MDFFTNQEKKTILAKWFDITIASYPPDTCQIFKNVKDPFTNPVGSTIFKGLEKLVDELSKQILTNDTNLKSILDPIIRIRAVQCFKPSDAVSFIFSLKHILAEHGVSDINARIDRLSLIAFDIYMECREKIFELKSIDLSNKAFGALKRAGLIKEIDNENVNL